MYNVLLGIDIILAIFLCILVMLQDSEGGALGGLGGGTGSSFMTGRSVGNTLTKATATVAALFFIITLSLSVLAKQNAKPVDLVKDLPIQTQTQDAAAGTEGSSDAKE
ncbi:MAG: preprotein translocase subunit SecG [Alphaproteobacteria bacterium]|nr:preprotein translocase subunit SecG [Alphaproteobacteria bacterium]